METTRECKCCVDIPEVSSRLEENESSSICCTMNIFKIISLLEMTNQSMSKSQCFKNKFFIFHTLYTKSNLLIILCPFFKGYIGTWHIGGLPDLYGGAWGDTTGGYCHLVYWLQLDRSSPASSTMDFGTPANHVNYYTSSLFYTSYIHACLNDQILQLLLNLQNE